MAKARKQSAANVWVREVVTHLVAMAIAALVVRGYAYARGKTDGRAEGRKDAYVAWDKQLDAAPDLFVSRLEQLLQTASSTSGADVVIAARSLMSARNEMVDALKAISISLNGDFDRLQTEIAAAEAAVADRRVYVTTQEKDRLPLDKDRLQQLDDAIRERQDAVQAGVRVIQGKWTATRDVVGQKVKVILVILNLRPQ